MAAPRNIPKGPITEELVEPFKLLLDELEGEGLVQPRAKLKLMEAYRRSTGQQILLNSKLAAIMARLDMSEEDPTDSTDLLLLGAQQPLAEAQIPQVGGSLFASLEDHRHPGGVIGPGGYASGVLTFGGAVEQSGTEFSFVAVYELPIVGPDISISGTAYLPITHSVVIPHQHAENSLLTWVWNATNAGVDALWRLRNQDTGDVILLGSRSAPFSSTVEMVEDGILQAPMPAAGESVALEVCFSAAGTGGEIELTGPATWQVQ